MTRMTTNSDLFIARFDRSDFKTIDIQESQTGFEQYFPERILRVLEDCGHSYTVMNQDNEIISIFGAYPLDGEGITWALHSKLFDNHFRSVVKIIKRMLDSLSEEGVFKVLKGSIIPDFKKGDRWMRFLGFTKVGPHPTGFMEYERF